MTIRHSRTVAGLLLAFVLAVSLAACGGKDEDKGSASKSTGTVEKSFLTGMVHHHESAIEMADIAERRGKAPFVTKLASNITSTQEREIKQMNQIYKRLHGGQLKPDPGAHDGLGLSAEQAGMDHSPATNKALEKANPFDRAFVDDMEPHHTGAVKMSKVVLTKTKDPELRKLAESIVATQTREVKGMNDFRTREYGGPVPENAGSKGSKDMEGGEHGGH